MASEGDAQLTVRDKIISVLVTWLNTDPRCELDRPVQLEDFGMDSLTHFNFLMVLEQELNFEFPEEAFTLDNLGSLDGITAAVCRQLDRKSSGAVQPTQDW